MAKNPSPRSPESSPSFCSSSSSVVLNKLKCLVPVEPSLAILGFFLVALVFILSCVFYLDYGIVSKEYKFGERSQRFMWLGSEGGEWGLVSEEKVGFLENGGEGCDLFSGDWVWDEKNYPLYKERDCLFLDEGFRCSANGRPDDFYTKWRWQPKDCNLPRFDAKTMLEKLRNRRVVFVGDSIGRNQWESLLCMLSTDIVEKDSVYEMNGSPITKHTGFLVFKFRDYNCTIEYYRAPFLVLQSRPPPGVAKKVKTTLKLDIMDWTSVRWKDADVLIFNTGHWWNHEKTVRGGCYFQEGKKVRMEMSVESAHQKSIETLIDWIGKEVNMNKSQVFLRTYAPVHFRGGDWKTGGNCHMETLPGTDSSLIPYPTWTELKIVNEVLSAHLNEAQVMKMTVLNVTQMTSRRKDGHSSLYYLGPKTGPAPLYRQDCSHWCLPGVPDAWNELLYALFLRREVVARTQNSTDT